MLLNNSKRLGNKLKIYDIVVNDSILKLMSGGGCTCFQIELPPTIDLSPTNESLRMLHGYWFIYDKVPHDLAH